MSIDVSAKNPAPGRRRKRGLLVLGLIVAGLCTVALLPRSQENGPQLTHTVRRSDLIVTVTEQGTLESSSNTEIRCKVRGQSVITSVVEDGTYVEPGDELVRLDTQVLTLVALFSRTLRRGRDQIGTGHLRVSGGSISYPVHDAGEGPDYF
ncbi:MAG: hypothetical protein ACYTDV_20970 [Planctomycetota bacterium]